VFPPPLLAALFDPALCEYQVKPNSAALYLIFICSARRVVYLLASLLGPLLRDGDRGGGGGQNLSLLAAECPSAHFVKNSET
jgi:hypothetical protein